MTNLPELRRRRTVGEVVSDSFTFLTSNLGVFAAVAGPAVMVAILFQLVLELLVPDYNAELESGSGDVDAGPLLIGFGVTLAFIPVLWIIYQLTTAGVVVVLSALGEDRKISAGDALDAAQDRVKDLLLASLKSSVIIFLFFLSIIGIPWGIKRIVQWSLIVQSIMLDGVSSGAALAHSAALVQGHWWYTLGRLILVAIVVGIPGAFLSGIVSGIIPGAIGIILGGCVGFFTYPYPIIATTLIFFHQKAIKSTPDVAAGL